MATSTVAETLESLLHVAVSTKTTTTLPHFPPPPINGSVKEVAYTAKPLFNIKKLLLPPSYMELLLDHCICEAREFLSLEAAIMSNRKLMNTNCLVSISLHQMRDSITMKLRWAMHLHSIDPVAIRPFMQIKKSRKLSRFLSRSLILVHGFLTNRKYHLYSMCAGIAIIYGKSLHYVLIALQCVVTSSVALPLLTLLPLV
jgi:hypothetical protein